MRNIKITPIEKAHPVRKQSFLAGLTLAELIIAVVIVGIVAAFAVAGFSGARLKVLDREANATLKLIQAAQKVHFLESNSYAGCSTGNWLNDSETCINNTLGLDIPPGGASDKPDWDYETFSLDGCVQCKRRGAAATWHICIDDGDVSSGVCSYL